VSAGDDELEALRDRRVALEASLAALEEEAARAAAEVESLERARRDGAAVPAPKGWRAGLYETRWLRFAYAGFFLGPVVFMGTMVLVETAREPGASVSSSPSEPVDADPFAPMGTSSPATVVRTGGISGLEVGARCELVTRPEPSCRVRVRCPGLDEPLLDARPSPCAAQGRGRVLQMGDDAYFSLWPHDGSLRIGPPGDFDFPLRLLVHDPVLPRRVLEEP